MKKMFVSLSALALIFPGIAQAVTLRDFVGAISGFINALIPIVLALAVLAFFWGLTQYLFSGPTGEKKKEGLEIMIMGVVVIFVMVSLWGLVRVLQATFKVGKGSPIIPDVIERNNYYYR